MTGLVQRGCNGLAPLPGWADLEPIVPQRVDTMRRYLAQVGCVLRPGSVKGADLALRSFAGFLTETYPAVVSIAQVTRRHVEDYTPWLSQRPRPEPDASEHRNARASPRHAADVLRAPGRVGLGRGPAAGADVPR